MENSIEQLIKHCYPKIYGLEYNGTYLKVQDCEAYFTAMHAHRINSYTSRRIFFNDEEYYVFYG